MAAHKGTALLSPQTHPSMSDYGPKKPPGKLDGDPPILVNTPPKLTRSHAFTLPSLPFLSTPHRRCSANHHIVTR